MTPTQKLGIANATRLARRVVWSNTPPWRSAARMPTGMEMIAASTPA